MSAVSHGAQWASRRVIPALVVNALAVLLAFATILAVARLSPTYAATGYLLMSRSEILARPTSGAAWTALKARADSSIGTPDISNQDDGTDQTVLAKALVYARIGGAGYRADVVSALKRAVGTEAGGRTLALGRNLAAYVISADLVDLRTADAAFDSGTFRPWLRRTLTESLDGRTLVNTHEDRPNNWGTHAGASRAAVAAYLGDDAELARTAQVFRGWLGDRTAYAGFSYGDTSWQCDPARPVGINPAGCVRAGIGLDGVIPDDMRRGGTLHWPPSSTGYPWEGMQGALLQAELLRVQGYDTFNWSTKALLRAVKFLYDRAGWPATGDDEWQPWLIDRRYGTSFHNAAPASGGKNFGFTDWLYGTASAPAGPTPAPATAPPTTAPTARPTATSTPTGAPTSTPTSTPTPGPTSTPTNGPTPTPGPTPTSAPTAAPTAAPTPTGAGRGGTPTPAPTQAPTPAPTAEPTPTPEPTPAPTPSSQPQSSRRPVVTRPIVVLSASSAVPSAGVPVVVDWRVASTQNGISSYQLQVSIGNGDWTPLRLSSVTTSASKRGVPVGTTFRFRVRAIDRAGTVGDWATSATYRAGAVSDTSTAIRWSGAWSTTSFSGYLGRKAHWTKARGPIATMTFNGTGVAWAGPTGPTRGKARVIVDGRAVATVDMYSGAFKARDLVFARNLVDGRHTFRIQSLGTAGRPTVAIDELYILTRQ